MNPSDELLLYQARIDAYRQRVDEYAEMSLAATSIDIEPPELPPLPVFELLEPPMLEIPDIDLPEPYWE